MLFKPVHLSLQEKLRLVPNQSVEDSNLLVNAGSVTSVMSFYLVNATSLANTNAVQLLGLDIKNGALMWPWSLKHGLRVNM